MKNYKILGSSLVLAGALAFSGSPAQAQVAAAAAAAAAANVVAPVVVKVFDTVTRKKEIPEGSNWLKAEVIHADSQTIIVRERQNGMMIHTFNFSPD